LMLHSLHLSRPLDLCVFELFKILHKRERKVMQIKGETFPIHCVVLVFYKKMIIPRGRWNFNPAKFRPHPNPLFALLTINPAKIFDKIPVPETSFERLVSLGTGKAPASTATSDCRRAKIRSFRQFAMSLRAHRATLKRTCHLCDRSTCNQSSREEKITKE
jgi:hypothetical protein